MWSVFVSVGVAAVAVNPIQKNRDQAWRQLDAKLIAEFPSAPDLKPALGTCNPFSLVMDGHLSLTETQDLICRQKTFDPQQKKEKLRSLSIQAHRSPSEIEEYVGEFIYPKKEIETSFQNLHSCLQKPKDKGVSQGLIKILGSGTGWVQLSSSIKNVNGNFFLNSSSSNARRLLKYFETSQIPYCDLEFEQPESIVTKPDVPAKISSPQQSGWPLSKASLGAYQLFATLHGSCEALELQPSTQSYEVYNPYVFAKKELGASCNQSPLVPRYAQTQRNPALTKNADGSLAKIDYTRLRATDCSSFVVTAIATAGLRIKKNTDSAEQFYPTSSGAPAGNSLTTHQLKWMGNRPEDCLQTVRYDGTSEAVRSGDILVGSGHTWIFPAVAKDPFGFEQMTEKDCGDFSKFNNARIVVMDSDSSMRGIGPHLKDSRSMPIELMGFAQLACRAYFEKQKGGSPNYPAEKYIAPQSANQMLGDRAVLLRPSEAPECLLTKKPILAGSDCISSCAQLPTRK